MFAFSRCIECTRSIAHTAVSWFAFRGVVYMSDRCIGKNQLGGPYCGDWQLIAAQGNLDLLKDASLRSASRLATLVTRSRGFAARMVRLWQRGVFDKDYTLLGV